MTQRARMEQQTRKTFNFHTFTINKKATLGIGSYGAVYKARCDQLPCAAKILHPTIVDPRDPGSGKIVERFQQECAFLSNIRHPNIVQYLCVATDPESGLPVLLMELIDESLTGMLARWDNPLPFHIQVDLAHDISLAISYLHSNGILHRDLSSNNVLVIANSRAKVTDFGMSKLSGNVQLTPMTMCPGTMVYMSPEAFREPPVYTEKLDCFSIGVLIIQICTRVFPDPGPRSKPVPFAQSPTGFMEIPVTEDERRKTHLELISQTHPLLPIIMRCLNYKEEERPPAVQLCQELAALKENGDYQRSKKCPLERTGCETDKERIQQLKDELSKMVEKLEMTERELSEKSCAVQQFIEEQHEMIAEIREKDNQLKQKDHKMEEKMEANIAEIRALRQDKNKHGQDLVTQTQELMLKVHLLDDKETEIQKLHKQLSENDKLVSQLQQSLKESNDTIRKLHKEIEDLQQELRLKSPTSKDAIPKQKFSSPTTPTVEMTNITFNWVTEKRAPSKMSRGTSVSGNCGNAYFNDASSQIIHRYVSKTKTWSTLPKCPHYDFSLAIIKNMLTVIGGSQISNYQLTNKLLSFMGDGGKCGSWIEFYPPMPTARCFTAVEQTKTHLIVVGGSRSISVKDGLDTVEVMDIVNLQWHIVAKLPCPFSNMTATICDDRLYVLGGNDQNWKTNLVLTCSLSELLKSNPDHTTGKSLQKSSPERAIIWHKVADLPSHYFSSVAVSGNLVAIGGFGSTVDFVYNAVSNAWEKVERKTIPRYLSHVVALPKDEVMVVGGNTDPLISTSSVEIGKANVVGQEYLFLLS